MQRQSATIQALVGELRSLRRTLRAMPPDASQDARQALITRMQALSATIKETRAQEATERAQARHAANRQAKQGGSHARA